MSEYAADTKKQRLQTVSRDIVWFIMVFVSLLFLILPSCVVLQNDRDVHIFSVSWYECFFGVFFLQVRNLTLAFQAAESIGIKPSLVS